MAVLQQYFDLTKKHRQDSGPKTVVLIQIGSFLEVYGYVHDIEEVHSPFQSVIGICAWNAAKRTNEDPNLRMAGVPLASMDKYVELLLHAGWTVAVYLQSTIPGRTDRSLAHLFTPGTFFSQTSGVSNHLLVIWVEYRPTSIARPTDCLFYGAACLDNMSGTVAVDESMCSPLRHDTSDFDWAQEICVAYNPRELRIVAGNEHSESLTTSIGKLASSILPQCTVRHHTHTETNVAKAQKQVYQAEVVRKCYGSDQTPESLTLLHYPLATSAFTLLLAEANASDPSLTRRLARPTIATAMPRLLMANHSLRQLNIVQAHEHGPNIRYSSVVRAITEGCLSNIGRREVRRRIRVPLVDSVAIDQRLQEVEVFVSAPGLLDDVRKALRGIPDAESEFRAIVHRVARPEMIACNLRQCLEQVLAGGRILAAHDRVAEAGSLGKRLEAAMRSAAMLLGETKRMFRDEAVETPLLAEEAANVARWLQPHATTDGEYSKAWGEYAEALAQLEELRQILAHTHNQSLSSKSTGARGKAADPQKAVVLDDCKGNIILRMTQHRAKQLQHWLTRRKAAAGSDMHPVLQEGVRTSPANGSNVRVENNLILQRIGRLEAARVGLAEAAAKEYSRVLDWYSERERAVRDTVDLVSAVDVACTGATLALSNKYCRPEIVQDGKVSWFRTTGLRHMLAERIDSGELFVPNDLAFGGDGSGMDADGMLLFGTNASGKSTLIKSVGIAVVLAQAGFYVPAQSFTLRPYAAIYTRILGNDDLFRGLSTFAVEMTEFNAILRNANARTLVLGDELCSGTETISAISIFASGLVALSATSCTHLFATHFHEVVRMGCVQALSRLVSKHLEVRYDAEADALVYDRRLMDGPGDSIYGLEVCKSLKMPQSFLDRAYAVRAELLPEGRSVLGAKTSRYSSKKVKGECELCGVPGEHVHHLVHQADADDERMVDHVRVDAAANLINVCEPCHSRLHVDGESAVRYRKARTVDGRTVLVELP